MAEDDSIAPPPPYRRQCEINESADARVLEAAAAAAANAQVNGDDNTPHVAPPSYEATHVGAAGRNRSGAGSAARKEKTDWNPYVSSLPGAASSSSSSTDCPHWAIRSCRMTSGPRRCCECLDQRPVRADGRYPVYIDGGGGRYGSTARWAHYCSPCQQAEKREHAQGKFVEGVSKEEPHLEETLRHKRAREAEMRRVWRAKAKNEEQREREKARKVQQALQRCYEQNRTDHSTHVNKNMRRERHAQKMAAQERAADERAEERTRQRAQELREQQLAHPQLNPGPTTTIDMKTLEEDRQQTQSDIAVLEAELAGKRAKLERLDMTYELHKPRDVPSPTLTSPTTHNKGKAPVVSEKQALALAEYEAEMRDIAEEAGHPRDQGYAVVNPVAAAKVPCGSSGSGSGAGSWFGRVFGRAREREERHTAEMLERTGERYKNDKFYAEKRAAAEARAATKRHEGGS